MIQRPCFILEEKCIPAVSSILQIVTLRWEWKIIKSQTPHYQLPQWYVPSIQNENNSLRGTARQTQQRRKLCNF